MANPTHDKFFVLSRRTNNLALIENNGEFAGLTIKVYLQVYLEYAHARRESRECMPELIPLAVWRMTLTRTSDWWS